MNFLKDNIIFEEWDSPLTKEMEEQYINNPLFSDLIKKLPSLNPYKKEYNDIFEMINKELSNTNIDLSKENIGEAYMKVHFFVNIQANVANISTIYKNKLKNIEYILEILETNLRISIEENAKLKIKNLFIEKENKLNDIKLSYSSKDKITTIESKFLQNNLSTEDKKMDTYISFLSGQKINNWINAKVKSNKHLNELRRKKIILESSVDYIDKLFKVVQENINGYKKIIDNLVFLYNANGGK